MSSPLSVIRRLGELARTASFWGIILRSLGRILLGFLLGLIAGFLLGWLSGKSRIARYFIALPLSIIKATPVASFVILALVWLSGRNLSIFIVFLMVLPIIWSSVDEGFRSTDPLLKEAAKTYRLTFWQRFLYLEMPGVRRMLLAASRVAIGFAWKSGIAGEVIAIPKGTIGTQLHNAKIYLETTDLFAWTVVIILLSVMLEKGFQWIIDALLTKAVDEP